MAKIDGWLEKAQFENIVSTSPTPTPTGRVYIDTTNPLAAVPRFYNGTAWTPFLYGQSATLVSQNSTSDSVTVNWANGFYQQVILTGNCVINFSNPTAGQMHTLIVTQAAGATAYLYTLNMTDQQPRRTPYQPLGLLQTSESDVYSWFYQAAIKPAYATIPAAIADPATLPTTLMTGIDIYPGQNGYNPAGYTIMGGRTSSPFSQSERFYDGGVGYWQKLDISAPTAAAAQVVGLAYHPDGQTLFVVSGTTPFIQAWGVDVYGVPNGTVFANPGTLPAGVGQCIAMHPAGSFVAVGHTTTPFVSCYPIGVGVFGSKIANPGTLPAAQVTGCAWTSQGDYFAVVSRTSPFLQIYPFTTTFGTVLSNPSSLPADGPAGQLGKGVAFNPQGTFLAMGMATTPFLTVYQFTRSSNGVIGAKTTPASPGATAVNCVAWSPCGNYLAAGNGTTVSVYDMSLGTGLVSAAIAFDGSSPGVQVNDIVWSRDGEYIFLALNSSPFIKVYPAPRKARNYLRIMD